MHLNNFTSLAKKHPNSKVHAGLLGKSLLPRVTKNLQFPGKTKWQQEQDGK